MTPILWTAVVTPLTRAGELSLPDFEHLLRRQEAAGNGIIVLGSTGEGLNLSEEDRRRVVTFACSLELSVPVMCGVGGHDLPSALTWIRFLETLPLHGYLMVTPIYSKPGEHGQFAWFSALMEASTRPCMLYNVPSRTGCLLNKNAVRRLAGHPRFWAIKEASGSVEHFADYVAAVSPHVDVYSGDDPLMLEYAPLGAKGLVSVASNAWPAATRAYTELALAGRLTADDDTLWKEASAALFLAANPIPVKYLLSVEGHLSTPTVKLPLHSDDMPASNPLAALSNRVNAWHSTLLQTNA
jgi:4-hydroxy-tetrahydrodipicolinate synthase